MAWPEHPMEVALEIQFFALVGAFLGGIGLLLAAAGARQETSLSQIVRALLGFWLTAAGMLLALGLAAHWGAGDRGGLAWLKTTLGLGLGGWAFGRVRWLVTTGLGLRPEAAPPRRPWEAVGEVGAIIVVGWLVLAALALYRTRGP